MDGKMGAKLFIFYLHYTLVVLQSISLGGRKKATVADFLLMSEISIGVQIVHQQTQRTALLEKFPNMVWFLMFNATVVEIFICLKIIKNC